jgi:hypothetical protein
VKSLSKKATEELCLNEPTSQKLENVLACTDL